VKQEVYGRKKYVEAEVRRAKALRPEIEWNKGIFEGIRVEGWRSEAN